MSATIRRRPAHGRRHATPRAPLRALLLVLCLLALPLCACDPSEEAAVREAANTQGVTAGEILLGSSLAMQGHASFLGTQTLRGAMSYLNHVNAAGGIHGRTIRVIAYDDSYDPPKCLVNTQKLLIEDQVFALFCYVGTPTTVRILPLVEEAKIPLLGMFTGANALREPFNRYLVNVRASYYQETSQAVRHLVTDLGLRKIAVFYQYDAYGFDGLTGTELALKEFELVPVAGGSYTRGTLEIEEGLGKIVASGAEAVVMIGTYDPCAKFIRLAHEKGFRPVFYLVSFVGADELARRLDCCPEGTVLMSQVVPPPERKAPSPLLNGPEGYVTLLKRYYPEDAPNFVGLEGFINARVLVEGLRRAGDGLTREGFIDAIESIRDFGLDPEIALSFSPRDHQGLDRVYFTRLSQGQFALIEDWESIRKHLGGSP
jgi:ABC-type branched-subunit amino acid transport system substrate-binding protein